MFTSNPTLNSESLKGANLLHRFEVIRSLYDAIHQEIPDESKCDSIVSTLVCRFGGTQIYIPSASCVARELRDLEIFNEFDGGNVSLLAVKHKVSVTTIYKIIKRVRDRNKEKKSFLSQHPADHL